MYTLFGAVGLSLLIACCNVANMLLARAATREKELAIRAAVGASRIQILRQLLAESTVLALGGGLLGAALAFWGTRFMVRFIPPYTIPVETDIGVRGPALVFTLGIAIFTVLLFGLAPALHVTRRDLATSLAASGKGTDIAPRGGGLRNALIVCEVALSIVLLTGAGALMRSFFSMLNVDFGFNSHNLVMMRSVLPNATAAQKRQFIDEAVARLSSLPGVTAAGASTMPNVGLCRIVCCNVLITVLKVIVFGMIGQSCIGRIVPVSSTSVSAARLGRIYLSKSAGSVRVGVVASSGLLPVCRLIGRDRIRDLRSARVFSTAHGANAAGMRGHLGGSEVDQPDLFSSR